MAHAHRKVIPAALVVLLLGAVGCSHRQAGSGASPNGGKGIGATLADYSITLALTSAPTGEVTFDVRNDAGQEHEFVVFETDLDADALPVDKVGDVKEDGKGVTHIDEIGGLQPGAGQAITLNLAPGNYVVICNLPGHYGQGMHSAFTVT